MRLAVWYCACALSLLNGCATGPPPTRPIARQPGEQLFNRMPQGSPQALGAAIEPRRLSPAQQLVLRQAARDAIDSVVRITTVQYRSGDCGSDTPDTRATSTRSGGSGVVISADGLILTNEHVIRNGKEIAVVFHNGAKYAVQSVIIDPRLDLAILRINRRGLKPLRPWTQVLRPETPVVAVSRARADQGNHNPCSRLGLGIVTRTRCSLQQGLDPTRRRDYGELVETTSKLEPGFSGGPLLDSAGRLCGINVAATEPSGDNHHRGYAIPFNDRTRNAIKRMILRVNNRDSRRR